MHIFCLVQIRLVVQFSRTKFFILPFLQRLDYYSTLFFVCQEVFQKFLKLFLNRLICFSELLCQSLADSLVIITHPFLFVNPFLTNILYKVNWLYIIHLCILSYFSSSSSHSDDRNIAADRFVLNTMFYPPQTGVCSESHRSSHRCLPESDFPRIT